jgi:hypothetical protein
MLLLDLDLADIARVLNDLGNVRLVSSTNLTCNTFTKVRESSIHPVLPENTNAVAERGKVGLDHAKGSVNCPEEEKDGEEVMRIPETFKLSSSVLLCSCPAHRRERDQHDVSCPSGSRCDIRQNEAHES